MINYVFFDLDQTLLDFDLDEFLEKFYALVTKKFEDSNLDSKLLTDLFNKATLSVFSNDGSMTNEERFWNSFMIGNPYDINLLKDILVDFYKVDFNLLKDLTTPFEYVCDYIKILKEKGYRIFLTTNPVFPSYATVSRILWAGLRVEDFEYITTFENSSFTKPKSGYFTEVLNKFNLDAKKTILIGNCVNDDLPALNIGIDCYLKTDHILNKNNALYKATYEGNGYDLLMFFKQLPSLI